MLTKWQSEFWESILSSPAHFSAFKRKQKNKAILYQYLHRYFGIKTIERRDEQSHDLIAQVKSNNNLKMARHLLKDDIESIKKLKSRMKEESYNRYRNFGLEIEYEMDTHYFEMPNDLLRKLSKYSILFNNGYDNDTRDRLKELRLRFDITGLKSLQLTLDWLNTNAYYTVNSGVHIHIDCRHKNMFRIQNQALRRSMTNLKCFYPNLKDMNITDSYYKVQTGFKTVEHRWLTPTFDYTRVMAEIISAMIATTKVTDCKQSLKVSDIYGIYEKIISGRGTE